MNTTEYLETVLTELKEGSLLISNEQTENLVEAILSAKKVFVAGAGRSGFMLKSFAMRMMHMGIDAYVVGETVTANLEKEDLLIIGTGSGETKGLISIAEKAKSIGGKVIAVTIFPESTIGRLADSAIKLPGSPKDKTNSDFQTIQPMGSLFEQLMLLTLDSVILKYMEVKNLDSNTMYGKHANLE
ncbi:6-phospho-3-hexuloisomerase [Niallia taxi]|uniref:6-phospho-3-hexuloisomerase n=1 Tax=Niallia taxi TaxID=2499688 RepID=UPI0011A3CE15|nr:6-phospho-3-hexuloisomerase [Niallia taxi]MCT2346075.1 6-phospho-3-hexuloisomerase [Niallia taxi]MDE5055010.1 6-phospho-3-hexuloisomerase [Niallia taxi]MED3961593.1 6-phospho-3-hexuloisomerase [Niallia taxi]WOD63835.1 6-phospho-3-hexuloisomerase [Niallia taxi]